MPPRLRPPQGAAHGTRPEAPPRRSRPPAARVPPLPTRPPVAANPYAQHCVRLACLTIIMAGGRVKAVGSTVPDGKAGWQPVVSQVIGTGDVVWGGRPMRDVGGRHRREAQTHSGVGAACAKPSEGQRLPTADLGPRSVGHGVPLWCPTRGWGAGPSGRTEPLMDIPPRNGGRSPVLHRTEICARAPPELHAREGLNSRLSTRDAFRRVPTVGAGRSQRRSHLRIDDQVAWRATHCSKRLLWAASGRGQETVAAPACGVLAGQARPQTCEGAGSPGQGGSHAQGRGAKSEVRDVVPAAKRAAVPESPGKAAVLTPENPPL